MSFHKIERGWQQSAIFGDAAYSERDAWVWLIGSATWKNQAKPIAINGVPVKLKRGQLSHSLRFMAEKFQWEKNKVDRFLKKLVLWKMVKIGTINGTRQNIITICNYSKYQDTQHSKQDSKQDESGTGAGQEQDKDKEGKEDTKKDSFAKKDSSEDSFTTLQGRRGEFQGQVIKLTANEVDELCKRYSFTGDRDKFRKLLQNRDDWYATQPYKTYTKWLDDTVKWLAKSKHESKKQ